MQFLLLVIFSLKISCCFFRYMRIMIAGFFFFNFLYKSTCRNISSSNFGGINYETTKGWFHLNLSVFHVLNLWFSWPPYINVKRRRNLSECIF